MSEETAALPPNVPAEVRIPFLNDITRRYKIIPGPISPNKGGGRHLYKIIACDADGVVDFETEIKFQEGALNENPHNGLLSIVLLAILEDHFRSFQEGDLPSAETEHIIRHINEAKLWAASRADERAARGVLGKHQK